MWPTGRAAALLAGQLGYTHAANSQQRGHARRFFLSTPPQHVRISLSRACLKPKGLYSQLKRTRHLFPSAFSSATTSDADYSHPHGLRLHCVRQVLYNPGRPCRSCSQQALLVLPKLRSYVRQSSRSRAASEDVFSPCHIPRADYWQSTRSTRPSTSLASR
jgi:hypothetical protein